MSGFEKQTYTQVPNSLFEIMNKMDECELKVVLYICRYTFGYHRDEVKISTRKLANAINMSVASVDKGADAAVKRGLIERITDGQNTTLWRAVVSDSEIESQVIQKMNHSDSENESQVGIKERVKKEKKVKAATPKEPTPPEILVFREVTRLYPPKPNWDSVVKIIQSVSKRLGRDANAADLRPFFEAWTFRGNKPTNINWTSWAVSGVIPQAYSSHLTKAAASANETEAALLQYKRDNGWA